MKSKPSVVNRPCRWNLTKWNPSHSHFRNLTCKPSELLVDEFESPQLWGTHLWIRLGGETRYLYPHSLPPSYIFSSPIHISPLLHTTIKASHLHSKTVAWVPKDWCSSSIDISNTDLLLHTRLCYSLPLRDDRRRNQETSLVYCISFQFSDTGSHLPFLQLLWCVSGTLYRKGAYSRILYSHFTCVHSLNHIPEFATIFR